MTLMKRLNEAPLTPELMKRLMTTLENMPSDQRADFTGRGLGLIRFLEEVFPGQETAERASVLTAFEFRMQALVRLRSRPEYRAWSLQQAERVGEPDLIHEVLIEAAAQEPLIQRRQRPAFDPVSFFKRVLALSDAEGRA